MNKPALLLLTISLYLMPFASSLHAQNPDPRTSWLGQDQHSFFFNPFSFHGLYSTGTSEAVSWSDASPFLLRSFFPAASADGNRFFVQYNNIPEKSITPLTYYFCCTIFDPWFGSNPLWMHYSNTFEAVRPNIRLGYFGKPFSGRERFSAGLTLDVIRTDEPYFGRLHYGLFQIGRFSLTTLDSFLPYPMVMEPHSSNISHTGLQAGLSLSWELTGRLTVGTHFARAAYHLDGKLTGFSEVVQPFYAMATAGSEIHNRRYSHYDASAGIEFRPSELNRILFSAGFLTGSSEREIDLVYHYKTVSEYSGSSFGSSSTERNIYYLAASADQQISGFMSASLLFTWQKGSGDLDGQSFNRYSTGYYYPNPTYINRNTSVFRNTGDTDTREIRAGFVLQYEGRRLNVFTGFWLADRYEAFETRTFRSNFYTYIQIEEGGVTESTSHTENSSGNINRFELIRYEIPAGAGFTVFPWLDLYAAMSYHIRKTGNPSEDLYYHYGDGEIGSMHSGSNVDPVDFRSESTKYRTDHYFGLTIRPWSGIHIRAGTQPVYNSLVESKWLTSLSVEIVF